MAKKKIRSKLQASIEQAKQERQRELIRRRLEIARQGLRSYHMHQPGEAVNNFHMYLKILEDWKGVGEGELIPSHFDSKKDVKELLLLSGVYWALAKLYDRTASAAKNKEFRQYLGKFILFSKGFPHQAISAETLRKFLSIERPVHREDFRNAYKMFGKTNCFVATALVDFCDEKTLPLLQRFRDQVLHQSKWGRSFVRGYYFYGPRLARWIEWQPDWIRWMLAKVLDRVAQVALRLVQDGANPRRLETELTFGEINPEGEPNDHGFTFDISKGDKPPKSAII